MSTFLILVCVAISQQVFGALMDGQSGIYSGTAAGYVKQMKNKSVNAASSEEYPYVVQLDLYGSHWCGGTLISKDAILTAAHCFTNSHGVEAKAGTVYLESDEDPGLQKRRVIRVIKHPKYDQIKNGKNLRTINDIAILKVDESFTITQYVDIIQIPNQRQINSFANEIGTILGWGETGSSPSSSILLKADLVVMDRRKCAKELPKFRDENLCAIGKNKKGGLGGGDSGGPFVKHSLGHPEQDILLGVISFAYEKKSPHKICKTVCDEGRPTFLTNVAYFSKWIETTLKSL